MISELQAKRLCCEDIRLIRGYERAVNDTTQMYEIHHLEGVFYSQRELIELGRYYHCPAEALIFLTRAEHLNIHYAFDDNRRRKMSESHIGRKHSDSMKAKLRDLHIGEKNPMYGKLNEEHPNSLKILQFSKNGDFIKEFPSMTEIERQLGYPPSNICHCCKGKIKSAYGYIWRYAE